ncbi:hypothetical protein BGZ80_005536 [Entomortierella chlamydospora]|uniref:Ras-GEF domain-containing protein n=1 Tax=Entomortierella chlamydospora TaxID=101097 RepID=A0A9P6MJD3_9FUNG|nr:hypothetical protein BGZ80_005536 [Entomortierella chlamydospora]
MDASEVIATEATAKEATATEATVTRTSPTEAGSTATNTPTSVTSSSASSTPSTPTTTTTTTTTTTPTTPTTPSTPTTPTTATTPTTTTRTPKSLTPATSTMPIMPTIPTTPTTPTKDQRADKNEPLTPPTRSASFSSPSPISPIIYSPLLRSPSVNIPTKPTRRLPASPSPESSSDATDVEHHSQSGTPPHHHLHPLLESPPQLKPELPPKPPRFRKIESRNSDELSLGEDSSDEDEDEQESPEVHDPRPQLLQRKTSSPNIAIPQPWRRMGPSASVPSSPSNSPTNIPTSFPSSNGDTRLLSHTHFPLLKQNSSGLVAIIPEGCVDPSNLVEAERINGDDEGELDQKTYGPSDHLPMIPVSPLRTTHRSLVEKEKSWSSMLAETRQRIQEMYTQKDDSGRRRSEDDTDIQVLQEDACKYTSQISNIIATMTKVRELLYRSAGITSILEFPPYLVAYQLTLIESAIFLEIPPKALLSHSPKNPHRSITASTDFFNYLTRMIEYSVLFPAEASARAQIVNHWVKVAVKLHELENFQTLKAVLCALGTPPIKRLKRTWSFLPRKSSNKLETLSDLMSEDRNYGKYREMMNSLWAGTIIPSPEVSSPVLSDSASSMSGSRFDILGSWNNSEIKAKDASRRPVIPFLGTFIMDMTYLLAAVKKSSVQGSSPSPSTKVPATSSLRDTNLTVNTSFCPEDDPRIQDLLLTLSAYQAGPRYSPQPSRSYIKASTKSQNHFRAPSLSSALQMTTKYRNFNSADRDRQFAFDEDEDDIMGGTGGGIRSMQQLILHYLLTRPWAPERMVDELSMIREPSKNNNSNGHSKNNSGWSSGSISSWPSIGATSSVASQSSTSLDPHTSIGSSEGSRPTSMEEE